ncbi:SRPBCC family protein [Georgenia sunbinii]|uniref:SRPBCC family protein n=1 Tax=Georgenia sunbinii TaxID=3117728 RepID=UPI002F261398
MNGQNEGRRAGMPWVWGATREEVMAAYPCDDLAGPDDDRLVRAVRVAAPAHEVYTWLGNLRVAPYSYDWIDNLGRRSPRRPMPELGPFRTGQKVMYIFAVEDVTPGTDVTVRTRPGRRFALFGDVWVTYRVVPEGDGSRLVAVLRFGAGRGPLNRVRRRLLSWGDLPMMRKQLHTLRDLAERTA